MTTFVPSFSFRFLTVFSSIIVSRLPFLSYPVQVYFQKMVRVITPPLGSIYNKRIRVGIIFSSCVCIRCSCICQISSLVPTKVHTCYFQILPPLTPTPVFFIFSVIPPVSVCEHRFVFQFTKERRKNCRFYVFH